MTLKEYVAHQLIGTPLEKPAQTVRALMQLRKRRQHPELYEIYVESDRAELAIRRIVTPGMNCIDVGAHLGSVLSLMVQCSPQGQHVAIEPIPYKYDWLQRKFSQVNLFQVALSDTEGQAEFYFQPQRSGFSGLQFHGAAGGNPQQVEILTVKLVRLDDLVGPERPIGLIKIDVEGGELAALKGGEALLERDHPIILFECTQSGLNTHHVSPREMYDFFQGHRYRVFLIKDWLANGTSLDYDRFLAAMTYPFQAFNFLAVPLD